MEVDLWVNLTSITKEQISQGRFVPSKIFSQNLNAFMPYRILGLCRDMIAHARSGKKDSLNDREILFNSGHAWAAATDTQSNTITGFVKV